MKTFHTEARGFAESYDEIVADAVIIAGDQHPKPLLVGYDAFSIQREYEIPIVSREHTQQLPIDPISDMVTGSLVRDGNKVIMYFQSKTGVETAALVATKQSKINSKYHIFDVSSNGNADRVLSKVDKEYVGKFRRNKNYSVNSLSLFRVDPQVEYRQVAEYLFEIPTLKTLLLDALPRMMQVALYSEPNDLFCTYGNALSGLVAENIKATSDLRGFGANHIGLYLLRTVEPLDRKTSQCVLDFHGRANESSVKNMQLQDRGGKVVAQFTKVNGDTFHLDYRAPLNALQAFGFALAQLERKR